MSGIGSLVSLWPSAVLPVQPNRQTFSESIGMSARGETQDMTRQSDEVVNDPLLTWRTVSQRGDSTGKQSRRSAMGSLDERQENVLHDLKRARPSATNWHRVVHSLFKEDRLILDLIDEIAIPWN